MKTTLAAAATASWPARQATAPRPLLGKAAAPRRRTHGHSRGRRRAWCRDPSGSFGDRRSPGSAALSGRSAGGGHRREPIALGRRPPATSCQLGFRSREPGSFVGFSGSLVDLVGSFVAPRCRRGFVCPDFCAIRYITIAYESLYATFLGFRWQKGSKIDSAFLTAYRLQHASSKRHQSALSKPLRINRPSAASTHPNLLTMSWRDYVTAVEHSPHHDRDCRLKLLRKVRTLLSSVDTFSDLKLEQRKAVAGVLGRKEKLGTDLGDIDWGWFGSMNGAGSFKNRIGENDQHLSSALEHIPTTGEVTPDDYRAFIEDFCRAFENSKRKGRVPTASRLLAMKRPDYFVCVDKQNIHLMSDDLGFARTTLDFERYWTEIIEPITRSIWWQVRRPLGVEGRIWDGRAAMLDAIYYQPT